MKKEYIIPIFVPHLGCPHQCSFCNQREISGQTKQVTAKDVKETIEFYLKNFKDDLKYVEVAFYGGSFTAIEEKKQIELLEAANEFIRQGKVKSIRISTRPDYIDKLILKRLKKYHVQTIEEKEAFINVDPNPSFQLAYDVSDQYIYITDVYDSDKEVKKHIRKKLFGKSVFISTEDMEE